MPARNRLTIVTPCFRGFSVGALRDPQAHRAVRMDCVLVLHDSTDTRQRKFVGPMVDPIVKTTDAFGRFGMRTDLKCSPAGRTFAAYLSLLTMTKLLASPCLRMLSDSAGRRFACQMPCCSYQRRKWYLQLRMRWGTLCAGAFGAGCDACDFDLVSCTADRATIRRGAFSNRMRAGLIFLTYRRGIRTIIGGIVTQCDGRLLAAGRAVARHDERETDIFALELTRNGNAAGRMLTRSHNLSNPPPARNCQFLRRPSPWQIELLCQSLRSVGIRENHCALKCASSETSCNAVVFARLGGVKRRGRRHCPLRLRLCVSVHRTGQRLHRTAPDV